MQQRVDLALERIDACARLVEVPLVHKARAEELEALCACSGGWRCSDVRARIRSANACATSVGIRTAAYEVDGGAEEKDGHHAREQVAVDLRVRASGGFVRRRRRRRRRRWRCGQGCLTRARGGGERGRADAEDVVREGRRYAHGSRGRSTRCASAGGTRGPHVLVFQRVRRVLF
jgi:hypothetical protein